MKRAWTWWIVLAGCSSTEPLFLASSGESLILVEVSPQGSRATAYALGPSSPVSLEHDNDGTSFYALFYDQPLNGLGLDPGPMAALDDGQPLPEPNRLFGASTEAQWQPLPTLPPALVALRFARRSPCSVFSRDQALYWPSEQRYGLVVATALGPGRAFVSFNQGLALTVTTTAATPVSNLPKMVFAGGAYDPSTDELWLMEGSGALLRGHPDRGFRAAPPLRAESAVVDLAISRVGEPFLLAVVTSSVAVYTFDGERWSQRLPARPRGAVNSPLRIASTGADQLTLIGATRTTALESSSRSSREVPLEGLDEGLSPDEPLAVFSLPGWGTLIGTEGGILKRGASSFRPFLAEGEQLTQVIVPHRDGLLFGGQHGSLSELLKDQTRCPSVNYAVGSTEDFRALIPLGDGYLALPAGGTDSSYPMVMLRP
ncbi:MAG: hypothetical protein IPG45_14945 [Deltaproteobacteria bacterium]|nr:hypothetical protein [Deltaproteobacteria bacterium]